MFYRNVKPKTYKSIFYENVQNSFFGGGYAFRIRFFKLLDNDNEK